MNVTADYVGNSLSLDCRFATNHFDMPMRLPRALRPSRTLSTPSRSTLISRPSSLAVLNSSLPSSPSSSLTSSSRLCRRYSCSSNSSGRSSSRDGSSTRVKAPAAAPSSSSSSSQSTSTTLPSSTPKQVAVSSNSTLSTPSTYKLPHVSAELVKYDSLFALHRPLLELPVQVQNRRSITMINSQNGATSGTAELDLELNMEEEGTRAVSESGSQGQETITVAELSEELAEVVDLSEDGTLMGTPYLARLGPIEPLKTVEEELAAEAKEEEALAMHEEQLHDMEKQESEPYDAWMIGQHQPLPHDVARYLASRPPHEVPTLQSITSSTPSSTLRSSALPKKTLSDLTFLSPFSKPTSSYASSLSRTSTPDSPSTSPYATAFSKHFLRPLDPTDASAVADQFLSHHQLVHTWAARNDFVHSTAESLRKAQRIYSDSPITSISTPVVEQEPSEKGTIKYWTEGAGWETFDLRTGTNGKGSPFLPSELVDLEGESVVEMDSVKRKRKKKITKHKYKKRR